MSSGSPAAVFADHWYAHRDPVAALLHAGLSTGDEERDRVKALELLRQPWCQAYLVQRHKDEHGFADMDGRSLPQEQLDDLITSRLEAQQALTMIIRDVNTVARDRIAAIKQLEAIRAATTKTTSRDDVKTRILDLLGLDHG